MFIKPEFFSLRLIPDFFSKVLAAESNEVVKCKKGPIAHYFLSVSV
jgi:hypothetical protein